MRSYARDMRAGGRLRLPLVADREQFLLALCASSVTVAHLGCTDSPYTRESLEEKELLHLRLIEETRARVTGFDIDHAALNVLQERFPLEQFVAVDVSDHIPEEHLGAYDLVIAGEVVEHVGDAGSFLHACRRLLTSAGRLCVTVPNACSPKIGLRALFGREFVHPDHHVYYGPRTLARSLEAAGFQVNFMASYFGKSGRLAKPVNIGLRFSHLLFEGPVGEGLIAIAQPYNYSLNLSGRPLKEAGVTEK